MKKAVFILLLVCSQILWAQNAQWLHIKNVANQQTIPYAKANTQPQSFANDLGFLLLPKNASNQITISAWNFADTTLVLNQLAKSDTVVIYLRPHPEQLNEVLVNPKNSWLQNKIYGFESWQGGWVFLQDKQFFVADDKLNLLYKTATPTVGGKTPKALFNDVLGNNYLLGKDSVQQFFVTDSAVYLYEELEKIKFDREIQSILFMNDSSVIYRNQDVSSFDIEPIMRNSGIYHHFDKLEYPNLHNCGVSIYFVNVDTNYSLYTGIDSIKFIRAQEKFFEYAHTYIGFWKKCYLEGDISVQLKSAYGSAAHTYRTQYAHFKKAYFFENYSELLLFDPYSEQLITFTKDLKAIEKKAFDFTDCPREEYLYSDKATGQWWLQRRKRGLDVLETIRPGDTQKNITLDAFVSNIRVYNNMVFYINQYGQLRVKKVE